jgi:hypothetical protein
MRSDTRAVFLLVGALALLGWASALWLVVRPAAPSEAPADAERWLVAYTAPSGVPQRLDRRLVPALSLLTSLDAGRPLMDTLAASGTVVLFGVQPLDEGAAFYDLTADLILVHPDLVGADPRALAALIAPEAQHAWDEYRGLGHRV